MDIQTSPCSRPLLPQRAWRSLLLPGLAAAFVCVPAAVVPAQLAFVPNRGQWEGPALFRAERGEQTAWFLADGFVLALEPRPEHTDPTELTGRGVALRLSFADTTRGPAPRGEGRRLERRNWFTAGRAITEVPAFDALRYRDVWPGVDIALHAGDDALEYDLCLQPGADVSAIALRCEGALALELDDDGALLLHTELGPLRQPAPRTWLVHEDGGREEVVCMYRLLGGNRFGFEMPGGTAGLAAVIDPVLQWASYLGGTSLEYVYAVTCSEAGLTVAGATSVSNFPTTTGAYDKSWNGQQDAFVSRLAADGSTLIYSTFLGGSKDEEARAVTIDGQGGIVIAGWTSSANFPTSATAFDKSWGGGTGTLHSDAFVTRLSPTGTALVFSTYLGGTKEDFASCVGVDGAGRVHVAGKTSSADFPTTTGAFDRTHNGGSNDVGDAFVACLQPDGAVLYSSSFLGGAGDEFINALFVGDDSSTTVAGWTSSAGFPTTPGALDTVLGGTSDAFVARLPADGATLSFSSFLGGSGDDNALALAAGSDGSFSVAGTTLSTDFPVTSGAMQQAWHGGTYFGDAFVVTLEAGATAVRSASYFGGAGDDVATGLGFTPDGTLALCGWTQSADLPLGEAPMDASLGGTTDAFFARTDPADGTLMSATYFGGPSQDKAYGLALGQDGLAAMAGYTNSAAFPVTSGSYDTHFDGFEGLVGDGFIAQFALELDSGSAATATWVDAGFALAGQAGKMPALSGTGSLAPLSPGTVNLENAAPSALTLVISSSVAGYLPVKGGTLVPYPIFNILVLGTDPIGGLVIPYTWPAQVPSGQTLYVQAWVLDAGAVFGAAASNAIVATAP